MSDGVNTIAAERELKGIRNFIQAAEGKPGLLQVRHAGIEQDSLFYLMEAADPLENTGSAYIPKTLSAVLKRAGKQTQHLPDRRTAAGHVAGSA